MTKSAHETHDVASTAKDNAAHPGSYAIDASGNMVKEAYAGLGKPPAAADHAAMAGKGAIPGHTAITGKAAIPGKAGVENPPVPGHASAEYAFNTPTQFLTELKKDFASIPQETKGQITRADLDKFALTATDRNARNAAHIAALHFGDIQGLSTVPGADIKKTDHLTASDIDTALNLEQDKTSIYKSHFDLKSAAESTGLIAAGTSIVVGAAAFIEVPPVAAVVGAVGGAAIAAGYMIPMFSKDNSETAEVAAKRINDTMGRWTEINGGRTNKH